MIKKILQTDNLGQNIIILTKFSITEFPVKTLVFIAGIVLLLNINLVFAQEHDFAEAKQLIDSGINCEKLTDEQLEAIGDYYMEQMHPGESHEIMDRMMGGEGSESLKQVHINMARRLYCNDNISMNNGMGGYWGMMGGGMMGMMARRGIDNIGSSPNYYASPYDSFRISSILLDILLIFLIVAVIIWLVKLLKEKGGRK